MFILKNPALAEIECWLDGVIERLDAVIDDPEHAGQKEIVMEIRAVTAALEDALIHNETPENSVLH